MTVPMIPTSINERWTLLLPEHRARRAEWPTWEKARLASMHDNIRPGDVVYDCGAEEGDFPALWAMWSAKCSYCGAGWFEYGSPFMGDSCSVCHQPNGSLGGVVLIEPNPKVWPNVRAVWEANELPFPLATFVGFASDQTVMTPERMDPDIGPHALSVGVWPTCTEGPVIGDHGFRNVAERAHDTPQIKLDDLAANFAPPPDVITVDVEGAELLVMRGAERLLREQRPLVYVSVHPASFMECFGYTPDAFFEFMGDVGYEGRHLADDHESHWFFWHPEGRQPA